MTFSTQARYTDATNRRVRRSGASSTALGRRMSATGRHARALIRCNARAMGCWRATRPKTRTILVRPSASTGHVWSPHTLTAVADGARTAAAATCAALAPSWTRPQVAEWTVRRVRQPATRFDERAVVHPTRAYARMLPAPEPGALRIMFLVSSFPLCGGIVSIAQLARGLIAAGHDVKIATEAQYVHPELLNLWTQPLIYRNRRHLVDAFPESDVVVATYWTTAYDYLPELRRRHRFASAYLFQDYEGVL